MEMKDTVELMLSDNYKDRFIAEYQQTKIRYIRLCEMLDKWDKGELKFEPTCSKYVLRAQRCAMEMYLNVLLTRAQIEGINLCDEIVS